MGVVEKGPKPVYGRELGSFCTILMIIFGESRMVVHVVSWTIDK